MRSHCLKQHKKTIKSIKLQQELQEMKKVFLETMQLGDLLISPKVLNRKKKELIGQFFNGANPFVSNTLYVLLEQRRIEEIGKLIEEFHGTCKRCSRSCRSESLLNTFALTDEESTAISTAFARKVGKQSLRIENIIDPSLIGGIRLQIGNQIYDSSVSGKTGTSEKVN